MVNFRDPVIQLRDYLALKTFVHTTGGIFLWEFITTLDYEFDIIRGHRPYRPTIWIYSFTRIVTLTAIILNFVGLNNTTPIDCQILIKFTAIFGYLGCSSASLLIFLRIDSSIAIWDRNKIVVAMSTGLWVANIGIVIQGVTRIRSEWDSTLPGCVIPNSHSGIVNVIASLVIDITLLLTVLAGLLRFRIQGGGAFGVGRLLWNQGVMWLFVATVAEVPPAVLIILDLNGPLNLMFQLPTLITMAMAATRMYRSLTDFGTGSADIASDLLEKNKNTKVSTLQWNHASRNQLEVIVDTVDTVDTSYEQRYQTSRVSRHHPRIGTQEKPCEKPQGLGLDNDPENPVENQVPV